jgi:hypothetical protein
MKGWRYGVFIGGLVGLIGATIYPVIIHPYLYPEKWKKQSKEIREVNNIQQDDIQPGGMKPWTDPFDRPGKPGNK